MQWYIRRVFYLQIKFIRPSVSGFQEVKHEYMRALDGNSMDDTTVISCIVTFVEYYDSSKVFLDKLR